MIFGCKKGCKSRNYLIYTLYCGKRGIRTPGTVARTPHFECGPIDHSGIFPFKSVAKIGIFSLSCIVSGQKNAKKKTFYTCALNINKLHKKQQNLFNRCLDQTSRYDCTRHHHKHTDNIGHSRKVTHHKQRSRGHHTPEPDTTDLLWIHFATILFRQSIDKIRTKSNQNRTRNNYRHSN